MRETAPALSSRSWQSSEESEGVCTHMGNRYATPQREAQPGGAGKSEVPLWVSF